MRQSLTKLISFADLIKNGNSLQGVARPVTMSEKGKVICGVREGSDSRFKHQGKNASSSWGF